MKRLLPICIILSLLLCLAACSSPAAPGGDSAVTSEPPHSVSTSESLSEDDIIVEIKDLQSNLNQWHRFAVDVSHNTNKYLTAEILASVFDANGTLLGERTVFVNNLGAMPTDWVSEPFLAKGAPEYQVKYDIISFQFTDGFSPVPEITSENVRSFLRLTTEDLGDIVDGEKEISVSIHNLSPLYCNAQISFTVKDGTGEEILNETKSFENIEPYADTEKLLFFKIVDDYSVEYAVDDFQFSDTPVS